MIHENLYDNCLFKSLPNDGSSVVMATVTKKIIYLVRGYVCIYLYNNTNISISKLIYLEMKSLLGQSFIVQGSLITDFPLQVPPNASKTFFVLVLVLVPAPHVLEHLPFCHSFHSQSIEGS